MQTRTPTPLGHNNSNADSTSDNTNEILEIFNLSNSFNRISRWSKSDIPAIPIPIADMSPKLILVFSDSFFNKLKTVFIPSFL